MANNQYGVRKRGKRYTARPYIPGRGHKYVGTFDDHEEATTAAIKAIKDERRLPPNRETIGSFVARWMDDFPRPKESTMDRYRADAQRFAEHVGPAKKLDEISVPEARAYARKRPHDLGALRAMYSDARRDGLVTENPFSELGIKKGPGRSEIVVITAEELGELVEIARRVHGKKFGPVFAAIVRFAANSGLRPGELFGLDREDIDSAVEKIHIRRQLHKCRLTLPKNSKVRTAFLPPPAAQALRGLPVRIPRPVCRYTERAKAEGDPIAGSGEMVFPGKEDQRISASVLSGYWKPVRTAFEATLSESRLMDFERVKGSLDFYAVTRHYCATMLVEQGVESWIVARQLGHEDGGRLVERVYGHPRDEVARERLRRAFGQNVAPLRAVEAKEAAG